MSAAACATPVAPSTDSPMSAVFSAGASLMPRHNPAEARRPSGIKGSRTGCRALGSVTSDRKGWPGAFSDLPGACFDGAGRIWIFRGYQRVGAISRNLGIAFLLA